jgi:hypothetical protein
MTVEIARVLARDTATTPRIILFVLLILNTKVL